MASRRGEFGTVAWTGAKQPRISRRAMSQAKESIFTTALFEFTGEMECFEFGRPRWSVLASPTSVVLASGGERA